MNVFKFKSKTITISVLLVTILVITFILSTSFNKQLTYNQVVNSKSEQQDTPDFYKSTHDGQVIKWKAKISTYYSQITGIKFCVVDSEHQNVDINKPCDWFWATSKYVMDADDTLINPSWNGLWVNYILKYYKVPFDDSKQFYNDLYTVTGVVDGIDCGVDSKCVPNIEITTIKTILN